MLTLRPRVRRSQLDRFAENQAGVSAIEFALIAPILILMFLGMADISAILMAQRRVDHAASSSGDLVAQFAAVNPASDLPNVFQAASDIIAPYPTAPLQMRISSLIVDGASSPMARVNWSCASTSNTQVYAAYAAGSSFAINGSTFTPAASSGNGSLPSGVVSSTGDSVIVVESSYAYTPPASNLSLAGIGSNMGFSTNQTFTDVAFFRPRESAQVQLTFTGTQSPTYSYTAWNTSTSTSNPFSYSSGSASVPSLSCNYQSG